MNDWLCGPHQGPSWRMGRSQDTVMGLPQKHSENIDSQLSKPLRIGGSSIKV
jgi:hypothetical protein